MAFSAWQYPYTLTEEQRRRKRQRIVAREMSRQRVRTISSSTISVRSCLLGGRSGLYPRRHSVSETFAIFGSGNADPTILSRLQSGYSVHPASESFSRPPYNNGPFRSEVRFRVPIISPSSHKPSNPLSPQDRTHAHLSPSPPRRPPLPPPPRPRLHAHPARPRSRRRSRSPNVRRSVAGWSAVVPETRMGASGRDVR